MTATTVTPVVPSPAPGAPRSAHLKYAVGVAVKEAIWLTTLRHTPGLHRDIAVFASYRGGSTWLLELLATERGLRSVNEPFSPWWGSPAQVRMMPKHRAGQVIHFATEREEADFRAYADLVMSGQVTVNAPWWFWRRGYPFRSDRLCVKITEAKPIIDWFDRTYDLDIVLFVRHPITVALSRSRNDWNTSVQAYVENPWFRNEMLGNKLAGYCESVLADGSDLERHVLGWALENLVPLRLLPHRPDWTFVGYEDCIATPEATLSRLADRLSLTNLDTMRERRFVPSRSSALSDRSTIETIRSGDAAAVAARWRASLPDADERQCLAILDRLEIPIYRSGSDVPVPYW